MRAHPAAADPAVYASDRLHLNARGHAIVGSQGRARAERRDPGGGRRMSGLRIEVTEAEILADLSWPARRPAAGHRSSARARLPVPAASARQATAVVGSSARPIRTRRTE